MIVRPEVFDSSIQDAAQIRPLPEVSEALQAFEEGELNGTGLIAIIIHNHKEIQQ